MALDALQTLLLSACFLLQSGNIFRLSAPVATVKVDREE
jgi:hypothetical protein